MWTYIVLVLVVITMFLNCRKSPKTYCNLKAMTGLEFERYITKLYQRMGYNAYTTQASGDFGADVIAKKGKEKLCIQCKYYKGKVGIEAVQQVIGSLAYYKGTKAIVITNSSYTDAARKLAACNHVLLIDGPMLMTMINKYSK